MVIDGDKARRIWETQFKNYMEYLKTTNFQPEIHPDNLGKEDDLVCFPITWMHNDVGIAYWILVQVGLQQGWLETYEYGV